MPAGGNSEVRLDLSSQTPEFGWIRVLSVDKGIDVSASLEVVEGDTLVTLREKAVYRHPEVTKHSLAAVPQRWDFDVTKPANERIRTSHSFTLPRRSVMVSADKRLCEVAEACGCPAIDSAQPGLIQG